MSFLRRDHSEFTGVADRISLAMHGLCPFQHVLPIFHGVVLFYSTVVLQVRFISPRCYKENYPGRHYTSYSFNNDSVRKDYVWTRNVAIFLCVTVIDRLKDNDEI
ncbi:hypothetical protein RF11_03686 [Thelohanellus kitauei]|uniref:Uncharacterized protein n=1 Tax=Thelohanellus kitauei TaxID=669202 RepID=A0A0C2M9G6_THEKT|nr:hypothetical protein RF11_03686 [Thelohanellus kitauei]